MTSFALSSKPVSADQALAWLHAHRREAAGSALMLAAVLGGFGVIANPAESVPRVPTPEERVLAATPPPTVEPLVVQAIAPTRAMQINAAVPIDTGPNPPARPFKAPPVKSLAYARALECLTQAIYYEAAREPTDGQRAVAQVVLNRVRHPVYPASVCGVVYQGSERDTGCQFTFTCDGALAHAPMRSYYLRARQVAHEALQGHVFAPVGNATHYHTDYVVPYWASTLKKSAVIGTHIFYRWPGGWGLPAAFGQRYSQAEADPNMLRVASLAAEARDRATPDEETEEIIVTAKQKLPEELAELVEAELGADGEARVTMRLPGQEPVGPDGKPLPPPAAARAANTPDLKWGLTGVDPKATQQVPLGQPAEPVAPKPAAPVSTAPPAGTP
ncbi:MAG: Cell wall hydrolyses involved in spore germination [uncultured Sphingomonas sp.]|uniref:Cell wall hydrolyses involved in spore germination n=1 Tax=uncultured Sphingomonas sp. TaxID=158754 RepID=A0A6J4SEF3_9SPHN|nr:cell wall hydrolase [uncultured Sphingomonas sp.]CAA9497303.1 MAG: Cell wall hydrolyses involved in spore germination [uncultured Sphingomonas sp.]